MTETEKNTAANNNSDNLTNSDFAEALINQNPSEEHNEGSEDNEQVEVDPIEKLTQELAQTNDKYLRQVAEFENFKKRTIKEKMELFQTAGKEVINSLLDVLDDSERAMQQLENSNDLAEFKEGSILVFNKLKTILQNKGLTAMDCLEKEFNPDLHEAITEIPAPEENKKGKILAIVQPGYYLNEKLIRHAKVVVGN